MPLDPQLEARYLDLLQRNRSRLLRLCRAWTRSRADLEDLMSEMLLQLWRSLPSFDGRSSEDTWLYRVALNVAMLFGRRERARKARAERLEREAPERAPRPTAIERLEERERAGRLLEAVAALAPPDRALVSLQLEGLSYRRISEITGLDEARIGVRLHRARKRLARLLEEERRTDDARR